MKDGGTELTSKSTTHRPTVSKAPTPNPKRVAAGRANRTKRKGLTVAGRERLRSSALTHQPWKFSTGPRTLAGKARSSANGRVRQLGQWSIRQLRAELRGVQQLVEDMMAMRAAAGTAVTEIVTG